MSRRKPTCATCKYMAVEWPDNPRAKRGRCYCRHKQAAKYQARRIPGSARAPGFICKTAPGSQAPTIGRPTWCPQSPQQAHGYSMREFRSLPLAERRAKIEMLDDPIAREVMMAAFGHFGKRSWAQVTLAVGGCKTVESVRMIAVRALAQLPKSLNGFPSKP